jgi:hypothetical protein
MLLYKFLANIYVHRDNTEVEGEVLAFEFSNSFARKAGNGGVQASKFSSSCARISGDENEIEHEVDDGETNSDFYNSDYNAEDGDDDLFVTNTDKEVNSNSDLTVMVEDEGDARLDHDE